MRIRVHERGYTLLELLVVLSIVGILVGVGMSFTLSRPSTAVRGVTGQVYGLLQSAQTLARTSGRNVALQVRGTDSGSSTGTLTLQYGFFAQTSTGADDFTKGPGATSANPVVGSLRVDLSLSRYAVIGDGTTNQFSTASPSPTPGSDTVLSTFETSSWWGSASNNLFTGSASFPSSIPVWFTSTGQPNVDFYVPVVGVRSGVVGTNLPVGLILATRNNGLLAFLKPTSNDSSKPWQRL